MLFRSHDGFVQAFNAKHGKRVAFWSTAILGLVAVMALTIVVLAVLNVPPFNFFRPVNNPRSSWGLGAWAADPYTDPRVAQHIWSSQRNKTGTAPKACFDPNGFAGAFTAPNAMTEAAFAAEFKICEPAWNEATKSFEMGPSSLPPSFFSTMQTKGVTACANLYEEASDLSTEEANKIGRAHV